jgi:hypothetical protein
VFSPTTRAKAKSISIGIPAVVGVFTNDKSESKIHFYWHFTKE